MDTTTTINTLNTLIETCQDGHDGYQVAAHGIDAVELKVELGRFGRRHELFAEELRAEVTRLGATPQETGTVAGAVHRGWMQLKEEVGHPSVHSVLKECDRGESVSVDAYNTALALDLPDSTREILARHLSGLRAARDRIRELETQA